MKNKNFTQNEAALGVANAFSGGIFLMLAFGHLLPHSTAVLEEIGKDRSFAFSCALFGYLMMFFVEKILFNSHAILHSVMDHGHDHSHKHDQCCENNLTSVTRVEKGALSSSSAIILLLAMSLHRYNLIVGTSVRFYKL
jgi:zinc transporter 1/2/3